jgi:NH3-dependent NAD+ synthetase
MLDCELADPEITLTRERIRARIRSNILMALANSHGWLHLCRSMGLPRSGELV